jgi:succinate-semialdehyde dehydrogenase/glutarate-semialdehyde dehydrogenase
MDMLQNFIDGRWTDAPERAPAEPRHGAADRVAAEERPRHRLRRIAAAKRARAGWARTSVWKRAEMCVAIAASIDESRARIARTPSQEQGKPLSQATGEVAKAADGFQLAAELVRQMKGETLPAEDPTKLVMTLRQPRGVYAVITPWNYPVNIPVEYLGPGLATGNTIVWVPAPTTSMAAVELMRAIEAAGLPAGVLNLVIGEGPVIGDEIVSHPDTAGIGFTGSAAAGRRIAERGAGKPMLLELGGNGPLLVFEDADLKRAAAAAANGAFSDAGQICAATGRVLPHESIADELAERIAGHARNYILGDPLHQGVTMGPLNNPKVAAKVREHVDDAVAAGASVVTGGKPRPDLSELFFEPTVFTGVTREMRINREETFGPVTPILSFRDDNEAMSLALDSEYGLSVGVFMRDMDRALRFAEAIPAASSISTTPAPTGRSTWRSEAARARAAASAGSAAA